MAAASSSSQPAAVAAVAAVTDKLCACGGLSKCNAPPATFGLLDHVDTALAAGVEMAKDLRRPPPMPKIVHQTWKGCGDAPERQAQWRHDCMRLNPGWTFWLWSDEDNRKLVEEHYPSYLGMYDEYDVNIKRIDAARLFILHRFGGLYMDMDFACLRPFDELPSLVDGREAIFSYQYPQRSGHDGDFIANNFMAGPPQHPLWSYTIHKLRSTRQRITVFATGPSFLTHTIKEYETQLGKRGVELQPCQNQTVCDLRRGDGLVVYKMPVVYAAGWKAMSRNPCAAGTRLDLRRCRMNGGANTSILATFWTMTWKQGPNASTSTDAAASSESS